MKIIQANLPQTIKTLEIHTFADEHIGDAQSNIYRIKERIEYVRTHENAYCVLNGDILDYASRTSISDIESRSLNIMEQIQKAVDLFEAIKDKIIAITAGNHEMRAYKKEGIDITKLIACQLGLQNIYAPAAAFVFVKFGRPIKGHKTERPNEKMCYTIFLNHGSGGGKKEGAKAIRLADMACICDADVYIHSHTHLPMIMKQGFFRPNSNSLGYVTKLFVNTAANLTYGGYGEVAEFKPSSIETPVIYLDGGRKKMTATL